MEFYERHLNGKISEFKAILFFMKHGYEIFYPISVPGKADFITLNKESQALKIQVKKATWSKSGKHSYLQARLTDKRKKDGSMYKDGDYDILAITCDEGHLWIAPWEDVKGLTSVCLLGTSPDYKPKSLLYDPDKWRVD